MNRKTRAEAKEAGRHMTQAKHTGRQKGMKKAGARNVNGKSGPTKKEAQRSWLVSVAADKPSTRATRCRHKTRNNTKPNQNSPLTRFV
jgi:hypothetical protein